MLDEIEEGVTKREPGLNPGSLLVEIIQLKFYYIIYKMGGVSVYEIERL